MMTMKYKRMLYLCVCTIGALPLTGCSILSSPSDGMPMAQMTFDHVEGYPANVASYEYSTSSQAQDLLLPVNFVTNPATLISQYLENRIKPVGTQGKLRVAIHSVSVTHTVEDSPNTLGATLGLGKKDKYTILANMALEVSAINGLGNRSVSMKVRRDISIPEHVSLAERERLQMNALTHMINDIDASIRENLAVNLSLLVR